jgi:hypothetical protein
MNLNYPILEKYYLVETDINRLFAILMNNGLWSVQHNNFNQEQCIKLIEFHESRIKQDIEMLKIKLNNENH